MFHGRLRALDRNESVTILHRGKARAVLQPLGPGTDSGASVTEHEAFGMWKDRDDLQDVEGVVRRLRKARFHAV